MAMETQLVLLRHAQAGDPVRFALTGQGDHLRPLTDRGVERMTDAAAGLASQFDDTPRIVSSPYLRARQTADILAEALGVEVMEESSLLTPDADPLALGPWLTEHSGGPTLVLVGHEPHLSGLCGWLLCGQPVPLVRMKKGGACKLHLPEDWVPGQACLHWLLTQAQLRSL